jgi:hypothetical protein
MKQRETGLGREFESPHLHRRVFEKVSCVGGVHGFDRAKSNRVDSTVGDDRKSSKTHKCKHSI